MFGFIRRFFSPSRPVMPAICAKEVLHDMLYDERFTWRSLHSLARAIGRDEPNTEVLLHDIGARRSRNGKAVYTLKSA